MIIKDRKGQVKHVPGYVIDVQRFDMVENLMNSYFIISHKSHRIFIRVETGLSHFGHVLSRSRHYVDNAVWP